MRFLTSFLSGTVLGVGLGISLMVQPQKIIGFLNIAGHWDPTLLIVFIFAVATYAIGFPLITKQSFFDKKHLPTKTDLNGPLIIGAALFGIGWGLVGLCPGPSLVNLITGKFSIIIFVLAMSAGMYAASAVQNRLQ